MRCFSSSGTVTYKGCCCSRAAWWLFARWWVEANFQTAVGNFSVFHHGPAKKPPLSHAAGLGLSHLKQSQHQTHTVCTWQTLCCLFLCTSGRCFIRPRLTLAVSWVLALLGLSKHPLYPCWDKE